MQASVSTIKKCLPVILLLMMAVSGFAQQIALPKKDSAIADDKVAFKSLFKTDHFNPNQAYLSQLNPKAVSFVQDYIQKQGKSLEKMKEWGRPYFDLYDRVLTQYGIPKEMKYLSVIESHLHSRIISSAGAVGPWQLMDFEAKRFGLRVTPSIDERTDYYKSTHAAAKLLKELYNEFGDWLLVVAAYNCGSRRVHQAMLKAHSKDFWDIQFNLPEETRNHVKKFIGTHYIFEGGCGLTTMTASETKQYIADQASSQQLTEAEMDSTVTIEIIGRYNPAIVAKTLEINIDLFKRWNPGFEKTLAEGNKYTMRISKDKAGLFDAKKKEMLFQSINMLLGGNK